MHRPRKAVLLAAGLGTRMRPLTDDIPKPMMPFWGKPLIGHAIDLLTRWGVREVLVNLHHNPTPIVEYLRGRKGIRIRLSYEPEILGTGGALCRADWFLDQAPFWMMNTDIVADVDPRPFLRAFTPGTVAALWLHPTRGPRTVEMEGGRILDFRSRRPRSDGTYTFCGLQLIHPCVLDHVPREGLSTVVAAYERAIEAGARVVGVAPNDVFWADLGTPVDYLDAHRDALDCRRKGHTGGRLVSPGAISAVSRLRRRGVRATGFVALDEGVEVAPGATLEDSVVWTGARLGPRSRARDAIIARDVALGGGANGIVVRADSVRRDPPATRALKLLDWPPSNALVLPLATRGSARSFTRLCCGRRSAILVSYSLERPENGRYARHAEFLHGQGVRVPRVIANRPREHLTLLEDVGDLDLQTLAAARTAAATERLYRATLDNLAAMHAIDISAFARGGHRLEPRFSATLYRWERELLANHLLRSRMGMAAGVIAPAMQDLAKVARALGAARHVLVHRDMQSSNVFIHRGKPVFIDFQGMRLGPAAYDVAALLCDPYVTLPEEQQQRLLDYYVRRSGEETVRAMFWHAAIQRLAQALGAYGRLAAFPGTRRFEEYIPPATEMMVRALDHVEGLDNLKALCHDMALRLAAPR